MNPTEKYMSRPELETSQGPNPVETSKLSIFSNYMHKKVTEDFFDLQFSCVDYRDLSPSISPSLHTV